MNSTDKAEQTKEVERRLGQSALKTTKNMPMQPRKGCILTGNKQKTLRNNSGCWMWYIHCQPARSQGSVLSQS